MGIEHRQDSIKGLALQKLGVTPPEDWTDVEQVRAARIGESKVKLAAYLEANPLTSKAHGKKAAAYSVTLDKQAMLTSEMLMAQGAAAAGVPYEAKWNAAGQRCEVWTLPELQQLAFEISAYVKPIVSRQQDIEVELNACGTVEEIESVEISYPGGASGG